MTFSRRSLHLIHHNIRVNGAGLVIQVPIRKLPPGLGVGHEIGELLHRRDAGEFLGKVVRVAAAVFRRVQQAVNVVEEILLRDPRSCFPVGRAEMLQSPVRDRVTAGVAVLLRSAFGKQFRVRCFVLLLVEVEGETLARANHVQIGYSICDQRCRSVHVEFSTDADGQIFGFASRKYFGHLSQPMNEHRIVVEPGLLKRAEVRLLESAPLKHCYCLSLVVISQTTRPFNLGGIFRRLRLRQA